jgi:putative membrane protein
MTKATRTDTWHHLHPLSPFIRTAHIVAVGVVVAAQQISTIFQKPLLALAVFGVGVVIAGIYGYVSYRWTGFKVTTEQIELKTGVLFRQHRRIPVDRIEAIDIARPLTARVLGLVELRTEVVSGGGSEMRFQFLDHDDAMALREFVLRLRNDGPGSTTPTSPNNASTTDDVHDTPASERAERIALEVPAGRILFAYGIARVLLTALISIVLIVIGLITSPAIALAVLLSSFPVVLAIIITTAKVVENFWGFRVSHDERGMIVRRGLLNELTQKVPVARIQGIRIEEPLLWRRFDYARLIVDVAGYRNTKVDGATETAVLAPVAKNSEIRRLLDDLIGTIDIDALQRVPAPRSARFRAPISHRFLSIAGNDKWAISRQGFIRRQTNVVPHAKAQSIRVTQGPWQRRLDLATLHIDTAGNRIRFKAVHRQTAEAEELAWTSRRLDEHRA